MEFNSLSRKIALLCSLALCIAVSSCSDSKSYAELLTDEAHAINRYLADHRVENSIPADTIFREVGPDSPFYRLDEDGNFYMQVLKAGTDTPENWVKTDEIVYFRSTRYNLNYYEDGKFPDGFGEGNSSNPGSGNQYFRFENFQLESSSQWGSGVQMPLYFLPIDCEVNLVVKSQYGLTSEIANVIPYVYNIRYYRSQI